MRRGLEQLDLRRPAWIDGWPAVPIRGVLSEPSVSWENVAASLVESGRSVEWEIVAGTEASWTDYWKHEKTLRAGPLTSRVTELLAGRRR